MEHVLGIENREHRARLMVAIDLLFPARLSTQICETNIPSYFVLNCDGQTMPNQGVSSPSGLLSPILMYESLSACSGSQASTCVANIDESVQTDGSSISLYSGWRNQGVTAEYS